MDKKKYSIGFTYTVWVDVESNDEQDAIEQACNKDYHVPDHFELQEYADPIVHEQGTY